MDAQLYFAMAGECIDRLDHAERTALEGTKAFAKLIHICADVAEAHYGAPVSTVAANVPHPPDMGFVRAYMLSPGDRVLRPDVSFTCVEAISIEREYNSDIVYVTWVGRSEIEVYDYHQPVRIASNRTDADGWNVRRATFDVETVAKLLAAFGNARAVP